MYEYKSIENLLTSVSLISKKYDDIAKITGENFNIFSVMQMESNERYTHSAIIGELLNPKGSHSQGSIFLKLFFEEINELKCIENYNFENSKSIIEQHIGIIDVDFTKGGFIDIVLTDGENIIVIENKIYAPDQRNQLKRYKNYYPKSVLLYLNLFGDTPSEYSTLDLELDKHFHVISYQNVITNWLEKCHKEAIEQPILRETIKQYLNLVKKLTNQSTNDTMSEEIEKLITTDNVYSIDELNKALNVIRKKTIEKLFNTINGKLEEITIDSNEKIEVGFKSDSDGIFIGYSRNLDGNTIKGKEEYIVKLKEFKQDSKSTDFHFFWYYPTKIGKGIRLEFLDSKIILELYRNEFFFQSFVQEIIDEELVIRNEFKRLFVK